jgi:hypothetical protein
LARLTMPTSLLAFEHRHALDVVLLQHGGDLGERGIRPDGDHVLGHHVARAAAELAQVAFRRFLRRRQQAQPPRGAAARFGFGAVDQVAFADDADQAAVGGDHRNRADVRVEHGAGDLADIRFRCHGEDRRGHHIPGKHGWFPPVFVRMPPLSA